MAVQWEAAADSGSSLRTDVTRHPVVKTYFSQLKLPHLGGANIFGANVKYFSRLQLGLGGLGVAVAGLSHRYAGWCVVLCLPPPVCTQLTLATWPLGPARPSLVLCQILAL